MLFSGRVILRAKKEWDAVLRPTYKTVTNRGMAMAEVYFSNFRLEEDTEYFLYVGELKNYGLNTYLKEALSRIFNRKFGFIAIVPDVFEQYNYENIIVINPKAKSYECQYGASVNCRVSAGEFMTAVSENPKVKSLARQLVRRQKELLIHMYESMPEMTLDEIENVSIMGPDKHVAARLNSKTYQYLNLSELLPIVDFAICDGLQALEKTLAPLWETWDKGIFATAEYSAAGVNSTIAFSQKDIAEKFSDPDETYLISRYMPHDHDPTVLAVVAGEDDVYIAGIADQCIEGGHRFTGSTFPTVLSAATCERLRELTRIAGSWLAKEGYRGIFGCDYLVTAEGEIRFLEINARKQGTTLEFCCSLEQALPPGAPILPELEYYAVTEGLFPLNTVEMEDNPKNLHWGTYNYKIGSTVQTDGYIPQYAQEREAFGSVANGSLKKHFMILEHTGSDFIVAEGSFLARIVALGKDPFSVQQGLRQGMRTIELTIVENPTPEKSYG